MSSEHVDIAWDDARAANLENWNDRVPLHEEAYGLSAFDDAEHLSDVVRHDLSALAPFVPSGSVAGLDVCHLQCHIGSDTVSLARAGARVTGVDFSAPALEAARRLAGRALDPSSGGSVAWVESDVLDARAAVQGDFDLVYTSIGTVTWLSDLTRWARQIAGLLRDGGTFYIRDGHPMLFAIDENAPDLKLRYAYFGDGRAQPWDEESTYIGNGKIAHTRTYEWPHPVSEVVMALIGAGLRIEFMDEGTVLPWKFSPRMVEVDGGWVWPEHERALVPCTYTLIARKPRA